MQSMCSLCFLSLSDYCCKNDVHMCDSEVENMFRVNLLYFMCSFIDLTEHFRIVDMLDGCSILNFFKLAFNF